MDDSHPDIDLLRAELSRLQGKVQKLIAAEADHWRDVEALRLSEARHRHIVQDQSEFLCRYLPGGVVTFVNRAACDHLGQTPDDLVGKSFYSLLPGEDLEHLKSLTESLTPENPVFTIVHRVTLADGSTRWHQWINRAIYDRKGRFMEYQALGRDITALREAEDLLRLSDEKHRGILDNISDGVYKINRDGYFTYMNGVAMKRYGFSPDNYPTRHFLDLVTADHRELVGARFDRVMRGEENPPYELSVQAGDGSILSLEVKSRPIFEDGQVVELLGISRDITARRKAEEALRRSEEKHRTVLDSVSDGVYTVDRDGRFTYMNSVLLDRYGLGPDGYRAVHFLDLAAPADRDFLRARFERLMQGEEPPTCELDVQAADGRKFTLEIKSKPVFDNGQVVGVLGMSRDITARRQAEEALRRSEEKHRVLLANISDGVYQLDNRGYFSYMNRVSLERTGFSPDNLASVHYLDIVTPEEHERVRENFERVMRGEEVPSYELSYRDRYGQTAVVEVRTRPVFENGVVVGLVGISHDVTARKHAEALLLNAQTILEQMVDERTRELHQRIEEQARTEERLRESEERYRSIIEGIEEGYYESDLEGRILYANPALSKRLGYGIGEMEGIFVRDLADADDLRHVYEVTKQALKEGVSPRRVECGITTRTGEKLVVEFAMNLIKDARGRIRGFRGIIHDITERRRAEEALRDSENRYRTIFENTGAATCIIEKDMTVSLCNSEFERISGYSKEEFVGKMKLAALIHEEDLERLKEYHRLRRIDPAAVPRHYDFRMLDRVGRVRDMFATIELIPGTEKSVGSVLDITERKKAENAFRKSEEKIKGIVNSITDYMTIVDDRYQIVWANDVATRVFGPELVGKQCYSAYHGLERPCSSCSAAKTFSDGNNHEHELDIVTPDGEKRILWCVTSVAGHYDDGRPQAVIEVLRDITDRKTMERKIRESEERYRSIFDSTGTAMVIIEKDHSISLVNEQIEKLLGLPRREIEGGRKWTEFVPEEDLERLLEYGRLWFTDPARAPRAFEGRVIGGDGMTRDFVVVAGLIPGTKKMILSMLDITDRKLAEETLRERERELAARTRNLEEVNITLNVLLKKIERDKWEVEENVAVNIRESILPYIDKIKRGALNETQKACLKTIERTIQSIASPFMKNLKTGHPSLSTKETQIAALVKDGRTTKEIANMMNLSMKTIEFYRERIRIKFGLKHKKINLKSYLHTQS